MSGHKEPLTITTGLRKFPHSLWLGHWISIIQEILKYSFQSKIVFFYAIYIYHYVMFAVFKTTHLSSYLTAEYLKFNVLNSHFWKL